MLLMREDGTTLKETRPIAAGPMKNRMFYSGMKTEHSSHETGDKTPEL